MGVGEPRAGRVSVIFGIFFGGFVVGLAFDLLDLFLQLETGDDFSGDDARVLGGLDLRRGDAGLADFGDAGRLPARWRWALGSPQVRVRLGVFSKAMLT
jgi:hypothetical protein